MLKKEYTKTNSEMLAEDIYLHDAMLSKLIWDYQDRFVSIDVTNWEKKEIGRLSFCGAIYVTGSALALWNGGVEYPIYLDCIFVAPDGIVSDLVANCVQISKAAPETCALPNPDDYFCVVLGTTAGDELKFIVEKVVWEQPVNPAPLFILS